MIVSEQKQEYSWTHKRVRVIKMSSSDLIILCFVTFNIGWNIKEAKKRPRTSAVFILLWSVLAVSIIFGAMP